MKPETSLILLVVNLVVGVLSVDHYHRDDFPVEFVFGSGTTAYQVEGAANEDGRTPSIWDTFAHSVYKYGENGDLACDGYHKYKEDVQLMVKTGLEAYRFSISWSRLIPNGRGPVNPKGLQYYNNVINELISKGIQPHVTLHNCDLPQALEDEYGGWVSRDIIKDFTNYADVCFREFGDRVQYWTTVNEPNVFAVGGYDNGNSPPQRCSPPFCATNSTKGNSTYEPYLAVHHILLSHSSAVRLYRRKYRDKQHGYVGISVYTFGFIPQTNTEKDKLASQRARDFFVGWIVEPLVHGDYPISMKTNAGARIPAFTNRESEQIKGSYDFIGVIYYNNINVTDNPDALKTSPRDFMSDMAASLIYLQDLFSVEEFPVTPWSLREELNKFKLHYGNPPLFIHENGEAFITHVVNLAQGQLSMKNWLLLLGQRTMSNSSLQDVSRLKYLHGNIGGVLDALRDGSNLKGYFVWSFLDVFELLAGYESSFGLYYVDRDDPELKRYPKLSAKWYSWFLKGTIELEKDASFASVGHLFQ